MRVLITGGTGSFGQAFVRRLLIGKTARWIAIYSRDEWKQAQMRERFNDSRLRYFIGDVRDVSRLRRAVHGCDVVVHAAALKRVEVCEYDAAEVAKTNVIGAMNVIEAAHEAGAKRVVGLSTDKACEPINAYGASKLLAEKLFLAANNARGAFGPQFAVTRYGNVAGSTGSVIPLWRALLAKGERLLPVTDPDCTRFWMTLDESVSLVFKALAEMPADQPLIPQLPAYRLGDLCEAMGGTPKVIGMRPGEKKHESMRQGETSADARRMGVEELKRGLCDV